jgi:DNA-binding MarR family transcriptional regulator
MTKRPSEIVVRAWARLMKAQQLALAAIERELKEAGLPPLVWYDVLLEVERAGNDGSRPFELERAMLLAQYNLSRLIDRIERAGYLERRTCEDDGRGQLIVITDRGKAIRRKMWPVYARAIESSVGTNLSAKQAAALDDLLGRLIDQHRTERARRPPL